MAVKVTKGKIWGGTLLASLHVWLGVIVPSLVLWTSVSRFLSNFDVTDQTSNPCDLYSICSL